MNDEDLAVVKALDDGSLYACATLVEELLTFPNVDDAHLLISRDRNGEPTGYVPVGLYAEGRLSSYIPAIPSSPPISPTYTPGAANVIADLDNLLAKTIGYFDVDVIADFAVSYLEETASAYCLSLPEYLSYLSSSRRKDFKRKLKLAQHYEIIAGNLQDVQRAWPWMKSVWVKRGAYSHSHINRVLSWLNKIEATGRAEIKIDRYLLSGVPVGINCCVIHEYKGAYQIDDYLTWFDVDKAPGLGIVSAINNLTNHQYFGIRYNLGLPGFYGHTFEGHDYKWHVFPEAIRLKQSIINIKPKVGRAS